MGVCLSLFPSLFLPLPPVSHLFLHLLIFHHAGISGAMHTLATLQGDSYLLARNLVVVESIGRARVLVLLFNPT